MKILSGREKAEQDLKQLKKELDELNLNRPIKLAIIQVGDKMESNRYVEQKLKKAKEIGIEAKCFKFDENITQKRLLLAMDEINENWDGILIQLPLPKHLPKEVILDAVPYEKDIDGLSHRNEFILYNEKNSDDKFFVPAAARAVLELIEYHEINYKKKKVAVVGRSHLVGKPVAHILKRRGASVSTFDENTPIKLVASADIVIVAIGVPKYIKAENIKQGAIIIDVGTNYDQNDPSVIFGDVDHESVKTKASAITPVPGGVGPLTVVCLLKNLVEIYK